jgi:hypothetical protein
MAKSMETLLAESLQEMDVFQKDAFWKKRRSGMPVEAQVNLAKECLLTESRSIRRNNGGTRELSEAQRTESMFAETDKILFEGMAKARSTAAGLSDMVEVNGRFEKARGSFQLAESSRSDYDFCRQIGLSHEEAMKVVNSGGIKG